MCLLAKKLQINKMILSCLIRKSQLLSAKKVEKPRAMKCCFTLPQDLFCLQTNFQKPRLSPPKNFHHKEACAFPGAVKKNRAPRLWWSFVHHQYQHLSDHSRELNQHKKCIGWGKKPWEKNDRTSSVGIWYDMFIHSTSPMRVFHIYKKKHRSFGGVKSCNLAQHCHHRTLPRSNGKGAAPKSSGLRWKNHEKSQDFWKGYLVVVAYTFFPDIKGNCIKMKWHIFIQLRLHQFCSKIVPWCQWYKKIPGQGHWWASKTCQSRSSDL